MQTGYHADFGPFDGTAWLNCAHQGALRLAPHLYNTPDDIDRALAVLRDV